MAGLNLALLLIFMLIDSCYVQNVKQNMTDHTMLWLVSSDDYLSLIGISQAKMMVVLWPCLQQTCRYQTPHFSAIRKNNHNEVNLAPLTVSVVPSR
jgi:hypothetical protein